MSREIYIPEVRTVVFSVPHLAKRAETVMGTLEELNFKNVSLHVGERTSPYWQGCRKAMIEVLGGHDCEKDGPLLLLEDDAILIREHYRPQVEIPSETDLLYLGGTRNAEAVPEGWIDGITEHLVVLPSYGSNHRQLAYIDKPGLFVRPLNMHSTHAVMFLNEAAKKAFAAAVAAINMAADVAFARTMIRWQPLLAKQPFWFQADGHNEHATKHYYKSAVPAMG